MKQQWQAVFAELEKTRHSRIIWVTFIAFALGPLMGGVIMLMFQHPDAVAQSGMLNQKAKMMAFDVTWNSYLDILSQVVGVGGVLVFGFVASWLFGREYTDGTAKDLLSLPVSRGKILNAKFIVYALWCLALTLSNLLLGGIIGASIGLGPFSTADIIQRLQSYFITSTLVIVIGSPISFFALWGRGFLSPIAFVALTLVFSQIIAAIGAGHYFPWAIPGLYSGAAPEYKAMLNGWSYAILVMTSLAGFLSVRLWWTKADQN